MVASLLRLVDRSRRPGSSATAAATSSAGDEVRRHPAMVGLNVSPVHGRHCICDRCVRQSETKG